MTTLDRHRHAAQDGARRDGHAAALGGLTRRRASGNAVSRACERVTVAVRPEDMAPFRSVPAVREPVRGVLRAVDARLRADFRRAVVYLALAIAAFATGRSLAAIQHAPLHTRLIGYGAGIAFVLFGVLSTRNAAEEVARVSHARAGAAAATPLRVVVLLVGYLTVLLAALDLFAVPVGHLLLGGAVTGIILGIAAQQALGNVFAGFVLLIARPYVPGQQVRVVSGALGGRLDGTVSSVGLLYTTLRTDDGPLNLPNSALLAAGIGPARAAEPAVNGERAG